MHNSGFPSSSARTPRRFVNPHNPGFQTTNTPSQIDCDKLAILCGYKNAQTARAMISYKRKQMRTEQLAAVVNKVVKSRERVPVVKTESASAAGVGKVVRKRKDAPAGDGATPKRRGVKKEEPE